MSEFQKAWNRQADQHILEWLQAAAEDARQRDLTVSLGQAECRGYHEKWGHDWHPSPKCPHCKAEV